MPYKNICILRGLTYKNGDRVVMSVLMLRVKCKAGDQKFDKRNRRAASLDGQGCKFRKSFPPTLRCLRSAPYSPLRPLDRI